MIDIQQRFWEHHRCSCQCRAALERSVELEAAGDRRGASAARAEAKRLMKRIIELEPATKMRPNGS